jgi:hypothetical protein
LTEEQEERHAWTLEQAQKLFRDGWTFAGVLYVFKKPKPQPPSNPSTQVDSHVKEKAAAKDPPVQPPKQPQSQAQANTFTLKVEPPVLESEAPFSSFYIARILAGFKTKYPDFRWSFQKDANGAITQISFQGLAKDHEQDQKKELESTLSWAVKRVVENRKGKK